MSLRRRHAQLVSPDAGDLWREEKKRMPMFRSLEITSVSYVWSLLAEMFLPQGYPDSVGPDYARYQFFDCVQAFCSSIAGLFASRAVLEGFGVGDENASATNAVLLTVVQDAIGRLATILFAWRFSAMISPEAKLFRFAADLLNDSALIMDCLSPALPTKPRIVALCLAGTFRAMCGVCAGASKAALSVHFAKSGNVAELNAKDASQETVVGLLGTLCGSYLVSLMTSKVATWITLGCLVSSHLLANYLAVRAVQFSTLNRQRFNFLLDSYTSNASLPSPSQIRSKERILYNPKSYRSSWTSKDKCVFCSSYAEARSAVLYAEGHSMPWAVLADLFREEKFTLVRTRAGLSIILKEGAGIEDKMKAWIACYFCLGPAVVDGVNHVNSTLRAKIGDRPYDERVAYRLTDGLFRARNVFSSFRKATNEAGWDVETDALCTGSEWYLPTSGRNEE